MSLMKCFVRSSIIQGKAKKVLLRGSKAKAKGSNCTAGCSFSYLHWLIRVNKTWKSKARDSGFLNEMYPTRYHGCILQSSLVWGWKVYPACPVRVICHCLWRQVQLRNDLVATVLLAKEERSFGGQLVISNIQTWYHKIIFKWVILKMRNHEKISVS